MPRKQKKKYRTFSEADMGSMKGYDPNLGVGKVGMKSLQGVKKVPGLTVRSSSLKNVNSTISSAKSKVIKKMGNIKSSFRK